MSMHHSTNAHSWVGKTSKEPPISRVKTIKIDWKAPRTQIKKEFKMRKLSYQKKKKNHYSRTHFAINGAGFSKLQMSAEAHPSSPLLNQRQGGRLAVPAGPDVPKCTCRPRRFWLCSSWGVSPQRSEVCEISAYWRALSSGFLTAWALFWTLLLM